MGGLFGLGFSACLSFSAMSEPWYPSLPPGINAALSPRLSRKLASQGELILPCSIFNWFAFPQTKNCLICCPAILTSLLSKTCLGYTISSCCNSSTLDFFIFPHKCLFLATLLRQKWWTVDPLLLVLLIMHMLHYYVSLTCNQYLSENLIT